MSEEIMEKIQERMTRVRSKKNFVRESQDRELKEKNEILTINERSDGGVSTVDLILEPYQFEKFSSQCRLNIEEFVEAINSIIDEEEDDWNSLRLKDEVNIVRDRILERAILKYAKEEHYLDIEKYIGKDINYIKRFDKNGKFIGEATIVTLTSIPEMTNNQ